MNTLFWISFFFASPPNQHTCSTSGAPLLEIRQKSEVDTAVTTKRIYNSGAWTLNSDSATARGCFSKKELRSIRRALQQASWKVTSSPIACFAYDPYFTEYYVHGKYEYTARLCGEQRIDNESADAIKLIEAELGEARPAFAL